MGCLNGIYHLSSKKDKCNCKLKENKILGDIPREHGELNDQRLKLVITGSRGSKRNIRDQIKIFFALKKMIRRGCEKSIQRFRVRKKMERFITKDPVAQNILKKIHLF